MLLGDFNSTRYIDERQGGMFPVFTEMEEFLVCTTTLGGCPFYR